MKVFFHIFTKIFQSEARFFFIPILVLLALRAFAANPNFTNVSTIVAPDLPNLESCSTAWVDYDNDGRLDLFLTGRYSDPFSDLDTFISQLWRNTGNGFTNVTEMVAPTLSGVYDGSTAWGDYDNDGRLDLLLTGLYWDYNIHDEVEVTQLWHNTESGFTNVTDVVAPDVPKVGRSSVAWGDFDNDGRLDFLLIGAFFYQDPVWPDAAGLRGVSQIWRNTGIGFTNVTDTVAPGLPPVHSASVAWADYDNDGFLDFFLAGAQIWRNTGKQFTNVTTTVAPGLPSTRFGISAWGDYDNDGRLDFLLTGTTNGRGSNNTAISGTICQIWRNTGDRFTNVTEIVAPALPQLGFSTVCWGDYDNDGLLDFFLTGSGLSQLWRNTGSMFTNATDAAAPGLYGPGHNQVAWGDYDNDGRLDFFLGGNSQIWRNNTIVTNASPGAPTGLAMTASSNAVLLSWNSPIDDHTPAISLSYNVRAGTSPGGDDLLASHVNATNGFRRAPTMGNANLRHTSLLTGVTNGQTIYWSVQAVDSCFAGGLFATEKSVVSLPTLSVDASEQGGSITVSWKPPTFGWQLQRSSNLDNTNVWNFIPTDNNVPVTLAITNAATFFRLVQP